MERKRMPINPDDFWQIYILTDVDENIIVTINKVRYAYVKKII